MQEHCPRNISSWAEILSGLGRSVVLTMTFLIPLAFFKETYYIFQIKTTVLQLGGWLLSLTLLLHFLLRRNQNQDIFHPWLVLVLIWALWMVFKSWNSISPILSARESTRLIWFPVVATSVICFFKEKREKLKLIRCITWTALIVTIAASIFRFDASRSFLLSQSDTKLDLFNIPIISWLLKTLFFSTELQHLIQAKVQHANELTSKVFPISLASFYPGKPEAGTFGNKNFFAGYLNLTFPLVIWQCSQYISMIRSSKRKVSLFLLAGTFLLGSALQISHLVSIGNRASWLGALSALFALAIMVGVYLGSLKKFLIWSLLPIVFGLVILISQPERIASTVNPHQSSIEFRLLTWKSWLGGFLKDDSWDGFSSSAWRWSSGWGEHTFRVSYPRYRESRIFKLEDNQHSTQTVHAHNHVLNVLGEKGIIGLLLGLCLVTAPFLLYFSRLREKSEHLPLATLLALGLITQGVQSFFSVAPRYTGVAFQTWLSLSLLVVLLPTSTSATPRPRSVYFLPQLAIAMASLMVMPNPSWPLKWLQSQHFQAQAQLFHHDAKELHRKSKLIEKELSEAKNHPPEEYRALLANLKTSRSELKELAPQAELYYRLSSEKDPANFESNYFGALMKIQFGDQHFAYRQPKSALQLYEEGITDLLEVKKIAPHFAQSDYWLALAHKGKFMAKETLGEGPQTSDLELALASFRAYEKLDPFFPDLHRQTFFCLYQLGKQREANLELKKVLLNTLNYGSDIFRRDPRFDAIGVSQFLRDRSEGEATERIETVLKLLHHFQSSTCLLPYIPKTQRHVKHSFNLLQDPNGY